MSQSPGGAVEGQGSAHSLLGLSGDTERELGTRSIHLSNHHIVYLRYIGIGPLYLKAKKLY